nr:hypothetical protein [Pseudonocardia sp. AL041005-10]
MSTDTSPEPVVPTAERPRLTRRRRLAAGTAIAVVLLGSAACGTSAAGTDASAGGSSGTGSGSAASGATGSGTGAESDALMACLEQNGVPAPPDGGPGGDAAGQGTPPSGAPAADGQGTPPAGGEDGTGGPGSGEAPPGVDSAVWAKAQAACASVAGGDAAEDTTAG